MEDQFIAWANQIIPWILNHGVKIVFILVSAVVLNKIAKKIIEKGVRTSIVSDHFMSKSAEKKREDTLISIFSGVSLIAITMMAIMMSLQEVGILVGPLLAGVGIVGLAFGFGGQYLIRDVITGLFIILENQYRIGDVVKFDDTGGLVENITLRMTTIRDMDGTVHHIPHGEIKKVSNFTKLFSRVNMNIGIAYDANLEHVIRVVNQVGNDLAADPAWKDSIILAPQFLRIDDFGDSSIIIKIVGDTQPSKQWEVSGELRKRIKMAFDQEGIDIPFPQRVIRQSVVKES